MSSNSDNPSWRDNSRLHRGGLRWGGVVFALVFPTIITWVYFVWAGRFSTSVQQSMYVVVKTAQFAFPLLWVLLVLREPPRTNRPNAQGLALGAVFSLIVVAAGWILFDHVLRDAHAFSRAAVLIHKKIGGFGIDSPWKYAALMGFYSLIHSLLEEYYWRWFVFRQLRCLVPMWPAVAISALGFMAHHVVLLGVFFNQTLWLAWLLGSAVAVGGIFWAWLYERTGSLFGPWLSHLLIDAGIAWIGYDLVRQMMNGAD
jgi:membrane protease YdiL (CAAX protease family)